MVLSWMRGHGLEKNHNEVYFYDPSIHIASSLGIGGSSTEHLGLSVRYSLHVFLIANFFAARALGLAASFSASSLASYWKGPSPNKICADPSSLMSASSLGLHQVSRLHQVSCLPTRPAQRNRTMCYLKSFVLVPLETAHKKLQAVPQMCTAIILYHA